MLRPGQTVAERYVVEELIGSGGLAHVYRVRHVELGSTHALKVLAWETPALAQRMLREGRIQAQLNHPHIVRVTDVLRDGSMVGLLMDYVQGDTLEQHLAQVVSLPVDECLQLMAPVLSAVALAHDVKVLHRDLKPANVLLERRGTVLFPKVTDFGIAKALLDSGGAGSTRPDALLGTPAYMAPEQFVDAGQATAAADVFSLAVILQQALTGEPVFREPTEDVPLVERIMRRPAPLPVSLPAAIRDTLTRALSVEPTDRYPDARSFAMALFADRPALMAVVGPTFAGAPLDPFAFTSTPAAPRRAAVPNPTLLPLTSSPPSPPPRRRWPLVVAPALLVGALAAAFWWSGGGADLPDELGEPVTNVTPPELPPIPEPEPDTTPQDDPPAEPTMVTDQADDAVADDGIEPSPAPDEVVPRVEPAVPVVQPPPVEDEPVLEGTEAPAPEVVDAVAEATPEPTVVPESVAEPVPEPSRVVSVVSTAPEEPEPEEQRVDVAGRWVGTADGRPLVLELEQGIDGTATGQVSFTLGTTQRTFRIIGTVDGERVELDADGAFRFVGVLRNGELGGTYTARSRGRAFPWTTRRD